MWKRKIKKCLALGLPFAMMTGVAGCGKEQHLEAEINPDIPVSEVQFPLKEQAELSFITSAPATSTQNPNERIIFKRLEKQTNVHIDWTLSLIHISEPTRLRRISYAVFCLKKKTKKKK